MKKSWRKFIFYIGVILCIDGFFFKFLIWKLPNESAWSTNFFYGYEYHWKELEARDSKKPLVLLIGSSIAAYSFHTKELQKDLLNNGIDADVEILSYAGMTPVDTILLAERFLALRPKIILYPVNYIDFRIHREMVFQEQEKENWKQEFLLKDTLNYQEAPQSRHFYPMEAFLEFYPILSFERMAEYLLANLLGSYRYRDLYYENLRIIYQHRFGRNTSYHGYSGVGIPEGIDSLGWTGKRFSFVVKKYMKEEGIYIQVVPEILQKGSLQIEFLSSGGELLQAQSFSSAGWKKIQLKSTIPEEELIQANLSQTWFAHQAVEDRLDYHRDEMGVRLQQTFGLESFRTGLQYLREGRKEDFRYEAMSEEEYREYFHFRLLSSPEKRPGIVYFTNIWNSKLWTHTQNFDPNPHYEYLARWRDLLKGSETTMILVHNPENPITLDLYYQSDWYKDQLNYLKEIESKEVRVYDISTLLRPQDFSDFHHLTFPAVMKMNPVYSNMIRKEWK